MTLSIGGKIEIPGVPVSNVVGIDRYGMINYFGRKLEWKSYTLISAETAGPFARWWMTDIPGHGPSGWRAHDKVPPAAVFAPEFSGLARLGSTGDHALSSPWSSIATYIDGPVRYGMEAFEEGVAAMIFQSFSLPDAIRL